MSLVQHASHTTTTGTTNTVTLGAAATLGNCLVVCVAASDATASRTITGITVGGSADNFAQAVTQFQAVNPVSSFIWTDQNIGTSSTAVVVTFSASVGSAVDVYEYSGVLLTAAVDKTNGTNNTTAAWSSGSTGTLSQAAEVAFGVNGVLSSGANTITGPTSPWTNEPQLTTTGGGFPLTQMSGFQQVSATTALTYSGTDSATSRSNATCIVTLKLAAAAVGGSVQPRATVPVPRRKPGRALWQRITGQGAIQVPAPAQQPRPATGRKPSRAIVRFTPVTTTNAVPITPVSGTIQPRATVTARSRRPARALIRFTPPPVPQVPNGTVQSRATLVTTRRHPSRALIPVPLAPLIPLTPLGTEGGAVYYPYHHRGRGRTR